MASCSCGTRDKPKPVSPLSRGLWLPGCCMRLAFRNWADIFLMLGALGPNGLGAPSRFLSSAPLRVRIPPLGGVGSIFLTRGALGRCGTEGFRVRLPAAAPRCVASLLACCAGKRFAFPQLRTLAGSNPSACPQEKPPDRLCVREACFFGWDGGIRTPNSRHQKPEFYR